MPYFVLTVALALLCGPAGSSAFAASSKLALKQAASTELLLAFDDEVYGERDDEGIVDPDNYGYGYGDDEDDENDSARNHEDDDDGWDIDEYERSERA